MIVNQTGLWDKTALQVYVCVWLVSWQFFHLRLSDFEWWLLSLVAAGGRPLWQHQPQVENNQHNPKRVPPCSTVLITVPLETWNMSLTSHRQTRRRTPVLTAWRLEISWNLPSTGPRASYDRWRVLRGSSFSRKGADADKRTFGAQIAVCRLAARRWLTAPILTRLLPKGRRTPRLPLKESHAADFKALKTLFESRCPAKSFSCINVLPMYT